MSTTNPPPGGQPHADDSHGFGQPDPGTIERGYEIDRYDTTSVLSVPVLVVVFFVLAFGCTSILFWYFTKSQQNGDAHPMAKERNLVPVNERIRRINRGEGEVKQPRLEPIRERGPNSRAITSPEVGENPPYLHPEDIRPEPGRTPELYGKASVSIATIIKDADRGLFPVRKQGERSDPLASEHQATAANAGRGNEHTRVVMPELKVRPTAPKNDEAPQPKKKAGEEGKKDEGKKEGQPPKGPEPGKGGEQ